MNESGTGAFWKPCAPPPFENEKSETSKKKVKGTFGKIVRTSHAIVGHAQFKRRREMEDTKRPDLLLNRNPCPVETEWV